MTDLAAKLRARAEEHRGDAAADALLGRYERAVRYEAMAEECVLLATSLENGWSLTRNAKGRRTRGRRR